MLYFRAVLLILMAIASGAAAGYAAVAPHKMTIAYASIGPRSAPLWAVIN